MMGAVAHYVKSHGLGNDYIVIDPTEVPFAVTAEAVRLICDRHRGVGSDGILLVAPAADADFGVRIFNPDGTEAEKSGNGLRIAACHAVLEHRAPERFVLRTKDRDNAVRVLETAGPLVRCELDIGAARFPVDDWVELATPDDADYGMVLGTGFPVYRGGPLRFAESVGLKKVVTDMDGIHSRAGEKFTPCDLLRQHAQDGTTFYQDNR